MSEWLYRCADDDGPSFTRTYQSSDLLIGKVVRTRLSLTCRTVTTRYFVWELPIMGEYETETEARAAIAEVEGRS